VFRVHKVFRVQLDHKVLKVFKELKEFKVL
jgi:hypothetical protein